jgi:hypothetical protein
VEDNSKKSYNCPASSIWMVIKNKIKIEQKILVRYNSCDCIDLQKITTYPKSLG